MRILDQTYSNTINSEYAKLYFTANKSATAIQGLILFSSIEALTYLSDLLADYDANLQKLATHCPFEEL